MAKPTIEIRLAICRFMMCNSLRVKRVLIVIKHDGIGGVERGVADLLDAFGSEHVACDVVALSAPSSEAPGLLAGRGVTVLGSWAKRGPLRRLSQLRQLRALTRKTACDAVLAFGPSPNALASLLAARDVVTVITEVGNPFIPRRRVWNAAMMWAYRRADVLVVLTEELAELMRARRLGPSRIAVIPSALGPGVSLAAPSPSRPPVIISVGRLVPSKRVADLVAAFAPLAARFPEWSLTIVGDGPERATLEAQVQQLGLGERVVFAGFVTDPWRMMARASIFVLTSAHEGFPRVLIEAMASGCALVSSDCRFGPRAILHDGELGRLFPVGDVTLLTAHLEGLMGNAESRRALSARAHAAAGEFQTSNVAQQWLTLLASLADRRR
ncbi:MAG TPA: glycosyltransferase [Casimicrobiaceae bacterium]|nr:glycosyltransferase [Casimicrobiaceae bacterium]